MDVLKTNCPECTSPLELPRDFDNVICVACGAAFRVREHKGAINLSPIKPRASSEADDSDEKLAALDEEITRVTSEIDETKSTEQSGPLQVGCGIFGIFWLVIVVIAIFMTIAKGYFGTVWFYVSLAVVIVLGGLRLRRRLTSRHQLDRLRAERLRLQEELDGLEAERDLLMAHASAPDPDHSAPDTTG